MTRDQFMDAQFAAAPEGLDVMAAADWIISVYRASLAHPPAPEMPRVWMRNRDGERACQMCSGFGVVEEDTGFTAGPAALDCPACLGTGSPHIPTLRACPPA